MERVGHHARATTRSFAAPLLFTVVIFTPVRGQDAETTKKPIPVGTEGADLAIEKKRSADVACYDYPSYFVVESMLKDSVGSNIVVKFKRAKEERIPCAYQVKESDFEVKNQEAEYFFTIFGDLMFLDSGTGPGERGLLVYSLSLRKKVYETSYLFPMATVSNYQLSFWQTTEHATKKECPDAEKIESSGLEPTVETKVKLDLRKFALIKTKETRCGARQ